jgi:hypothetical protein
VFVASVCTVGRVAAAPDVSPRPAAPAISVPLAGTTVAAGGTWAEVAMGDLRDPDNTFWELFERPAGSGRWSLVTPAGVADNGGLVVATAGSQTAAGFEPSQLLTFSPLAETANGGRDWTSALLNTSLAAAPDALALGPNGRALALVRGSGGAVYSSTNGLSGWRLLTRASAIAASPAGRVCGVGALRAVAFGAAGTVMVATSCSRPGVVGVFRLDGTSWSAAAPQLPVGYSAATTTVARLDSTAGQVSALVVARAGRRSVLFGALQTAGSGGWRLSAPLGVAPSSKLTATGAFAAGGEVVTLSAGGGDEIEVLAGAGGSWRVLPTPPRGIASVAVSGSGAIDALCVSDATMTDYALETGSGQSGTARWRPGQVVKVPLQEGSSS